MFLEGLAAFCALIILAIMLAKLYNVLKLGQAYDQNIIIISSAVIAVMWLLCFFALATSIAYEETDVITQPTEDTITVTSTTNSYFITNLFFWFASILASISAMLTIAEFLLLFPNFFNAKFSKVG